MKIKIKLTKSEDGRFWIRTINQIQCAGCLYVQPSNLLKRKNGIVIGYEIKKENEQHAEGCIQK